MTKEYPTTTTNEYIKVGEITSPKTLERLDILHGLASELVAQLVECSKQDHVVVNCPNDIKSRFRSPEAVDEWMKKGRLVLPLVRNLGEKPVPELSGIIWYGPGKNELDDDLTKTFAIRIYEDAVGQGFASPYVEETLRIHGEEFGNDGLWLEVWADNPAATKTYEKAGYKVIDERVVDKNGVRTTRYTMKYVGLAAE